jgi:predicted Zn-dependent peptidase
LTRAKNRTETDFAHHIENYDTRADVIGMMATYFNDPSLVDRWLEPYHRSTTADLAKVAQKYLVPANRATSIFVPERSAA